MTAFPTLHRPLAALISLAALACVPACTVTAPRGAGVTTVTFWGWAPGYAEAVARFNATHHDVRVEFRTIAPGSQGGYAAILAAAKDGSAPCLVQIGYESLASFAADGALQPISGNALGNRVRYIETAWQQTTVAGEIYGYPVDIAPMALYYRTDVYDRYRLKPQSTWQDLAQDAARLRQAGAGHFLTAFTPDDPWWFASLNAQGGGSWFDVKGRSWQVTMTDPNSAKVTAYWQSLLDKGLVKTEKAYSDQLFTDLQNGTVAALPAPVWFSSLLAEKAPGAAGKWAVAPMPQWNAGETSSGFDGGSATAVLKGCTTGQPALDFANWLGSDRSSLEILVAKAGIYPAAVIADTLPALNRADPYFGNQVIFDVFRNAQGGNRWTWGPVMNQTSASLGTELTRAADNHTPLRSALQVVRDRTVDAMKDKNIDITSG